MLNGHGIAHGGMIFSLADTAFAYACNSRNETAWRRTRRSRSWRRRAQAIVLVAEAREASRAGRTGVYQVSVRVHEGGVVAEFTGLSRTIGGAVITAT